MKKQVEHLKEIRGERRVREIRRNREKLGEIDFARASVLPPGVMSDRHVMASTWGGEGEQSGEMGFCIKLVKK